MIKYKTFYNQKINPNKNKIQLKIKIMRIQYK